MTQVQVYNASIALGLTLVGIGVTLMAGVGPALALVGLLVLWLTIHAARLLTARREP